MPYRSSYKQAVTYKSLIKKYDKVSSLEIETRIRNSPTPPLFSFPFISVKKLNLPSRPVPSRGLSSCGTTELLLSLAGPDVFPALLDMFSNVSAIDTTAVPPPRVETDSAATADDVVVVVVVAWEEVAMETSGWLAVLPDAEFRTPPTSWGFKAINAEAPETAGRSRGLEVVSVPEKLGKGFPRGLLKRVSTLLLSDWLLGKWSGGAVICVTEGKGLFCCCNKSEMVRLKDGRGSMAAAWAWFWRRVARSWKWTGCNTCPSTSLERKAKAAFTFGLRKPKGLRLTSDLPSPAEGCSIFNRFWLRRCCWFTGKEIGRELRRFWFKEGGRLLFEELFCGKWSECSWPAKGKSPPMGSWLWRGFPAAVVTITPSWRTDVVFVMAGWLVPAMAIDDDGPEPPAMQKNRSINGMLSAGRQSFESQSY